MALESPMMCSWGIEHVFWNWHMRGLVVVVIKGHKVATCSDTFAFGDSACLVCKRFNNLGIKCINVATLCHSQRSSSEDWLVVSVYDHSNPTSPGLIVFCVHGDNVVGSGRGLGFRLLFFGAMEALKNYVGRCLKLNACWTYVISLMNINQQEMVRSVCESEWQCNHESNMTNTNRNI